MYSHYPYQFDFQPQVHLRTDYPQHSYPHSQYQDQQTQQEIQIRGQNQQPRGAQPSHYQFVSTPSTTIDTPTPGYMTCPTTVTPTMPYYAHSPQQELIFTDPLIRPQGSDASDANVNIHDADNTPTERHYSCDYEYEWGMEQSTSPNSSQAPEQQQQHQQQHTQSYPLQSLSPPLTYSPSQSIPSSSKPQIHSPHSQIQSPCEPSSPMTHVPPPRLTRPVRREREQPFKAFHPYANARPTASLGEKEKEKRKDDSPINRDESSVGSSPVSSAKPTLTTTIPTSSPSTPPSAASASTPVLAAPPPTKTQTQGQKPNKTLASITIPDPVSAHITTPAPIFGLFGSYPLSRGQALPGPTCAPETSSSVMRLVIAPGALTPNGVAPGGHTGKKEKSERTANATAAVAVSPSGPNSTMLATSVSMTMTMTPALDFAGSAATQIPPPNSTSTSTFSVSTNAAGQSVPGAAAASSSSASVLNNFNTPTPGLSAAPSSNPNAMAMRKPRMACYFCRKRKIACGPGPEAIALAQEAQARAQAQQQVATPTATTTATTATTTTTTTTVQLEQGEGQGEALSETTSTEDSGSNLSSTGEGNNASATSPTSPSVSTPPVLLSSPPLQTLTGDEGPCNQCARRGLACERPTESKRGVRKGKSKKEKEKEAREKEAKEKELAKKGGDTEKSKKDGNKDQSDDEGGMDDDDDDADMDGNGEADPEEGDEVGNDEVVSPTVASTDPIPLRPLLSPTTTSTTPSLTKSGPSSSSIVITKPLNRGRGRPPKHLTYANLNPALAPASSAAVSSKGGMKSMTSSFKWTTSTTDNKWKTRGKGKGKGKKKDVSEVVVEDVALSVSAAVVVRNEDKHQTDSRIEDVHVEVEDEQQPQLKSEPLYEDERLGDLESDEDMEEEIVRQGGGGEEGVDQSRNDGGEIGSPIDSEGSNSSLTPTPTIMNSDIPVQVHLEAQQPPSYSVESSLSPMVPVDLQDPSNVVSHSPNETYPMSTPVQVTIPPYDSYGLYAHGHSHSPVVEQHHNQHGYHTPDESVKSSDDVHPHSTTSPYTSADVTMHQEGNNEAYHSSQVSPMVAPVFNSHDGMYVMEYSPDMMEQAHGSMAVAHPNMGTASMDMHPYYASGVQSVADSYHMCVEYETETGPYDVGMQQQQRHQIQHQHSVPLNAEPYGTHAVNGYAADPMSGMEYDHTQTQAYANTASENEYESYSYPYGYGGGYAQ